MRLSEAIREGSKLKPQGFGNKSISPHNDSVCALGAASSTCDAEFLRRHDVSTYGTGNKLYPALEDKWPVLRCMVDNPFTYNIGGGLISLRTAIVCMNDLSKLSREHIADYVEQVENEYEAKCGAGKIDV